jgi:hypothetical protein
LGHGNTNSHPNPTTTPHIDDTLPFFGCAPGPFELSMALEILWDLIIAIMHNTEWNPYKLHGKKQHLVPPPEFLDNSIPFTKGLQLIVDIPIDP